MIEKGQRVTIPVSRIEYDEGQNTLWIHNSQGCTVLRIKCQRGITSTICSDNPSSHGDLYSAHALTMCLHEDDVP